MNRKDTAKMLHTKSCKNQKTIKSVKRESMLRMSKLCKYWFDVNNQVTMEIKVRVVYDIGIACLCDIVCEHEQSVLGSQQVKTNTAKLTPPPFFSFIVQRETHANNFTSLTTTTFVHLPV